MQVCNHVASELSLCKLNRSRNSIERQVLEVILLSPLLVFLILQYQY